MFTLITIILLGLGGLIAFQGYRQEKKGRIFIGVAVILLAFFLLWFPNFWAEKLWFDSISYNKRFWTLFFVEGGMIIAGGLIGAGITALLLFLIFRSRRLMFYGAVALSALIGGSWGAGNWSAFLKFWHRIDSGLADPILGQDTGFYLFTLPFLDSFHGLVLVLSFIGLIVAFLARYRLVIDQKSIQLLPSISSRARQLDRALYINGGILLILGGLRKYLDRFHTLYSDLGAVSGPGWTDHNIILPTLMVLFIISILGGILLFIPAVRDRIHRINARFRINNNGSPIHTIGFVAVLVLLTWFVGLGVIPGAFQSFRVNPNEISYEKPYIANNIEFTRHGFNLHTVEDKEFPAAETFTRDMVEKNQSIFNNIRLWDWRALDAVLKQFQEIRLYYEFNDVDIDRYTYNGEYRQVMVSAREMQSSNLPAESQTFVNEVFKYTHGYGIALTTVTDFTEEGLPNFLVKNIPPESKYKELEVTQPQIYYGELTNNYVITNSSEQEFDFPKGDVNEYISYPGTGGVQLSNFWRKLIFADKMEDLNLLLSSYPTSESRIMFRRQIEKRVKELAPFLDFDGDPYIVNADGKLYWMMDAFTTSKYFPYSEPFSSREIIQYKEGNSTRTLQVNHDRYLEGVNYIRNSVKAVVNAFDGNVEFYIFDEDDTLIKVWDKIFPGMFKNKNEMPESLRSHIRYPSDYLLTQGLVYAKYHMGDPEVFYNQEDLWIRATEKYYGDVRPVQPYYIMWEQQGSDEPEFSLILPFTPKNRQVSIGWIAGLCDKENYGRFLAYNFPKEKRILGPQQVETKIDQNSFLSGQLSLWDQRGSSVIRGNVLAIPVENTLIYVEPIYLQAETAAYPELRLVCVMHDDKLSYAETFEQALAGLFEDEGPVPDSGDTDSRPSQSSGSTDEMIQQAKAAFDEYLEATGQKRFQDASRALEQLGNSLEELYQKDTGSPQSDTTQVEEN